MLPQSHFISFDDIKCKKFSNALRDSSVSIISCMCQTVVQELDKIHVLHARKFCRPTSGSGVLEQSPYSASVERVLVYIRSV